MDWATSNHRPPKRPDPPAPVRIEERWRVTMAPTGRELTCGLFVHPHGVEVRYGRSAIDLLQSQLAKTIDDARVVADAWLESVKATGRATVLRAGGADVCTPNEQ